MQRTLLIGRSRFLVRKLRSRSCASLIVSGSIDTDIFLLSPRDHPTQVVQQAIPAWWQLCLSKQLYDRRFA